ncbi:MAG: hypothetical protein M3176_17045, partial [Chloroflexota bacterium]|nr:hypothetical protein [Chloroflexota bacterium]
MATALPTSPIPEAMVAHWRQWLRVPAVLIGGATVAGLIGGALAITVGPILPLALLIGIVGGVAILLDARIGLYGAVAVIALLPYA